MEFYVINAEEQGLDSPDYACGLIGILAMLQDLDLSPSLGKVITEAISKQVTYKAGWAEEIEILLESWHPFRALSVPGYIDVSAEYLDRLHMLK
ncbi:hypothetical protein GCM10009554_46330 [Kribbella koreensis]|uniref:Uncharacterized protein n=1 Tax=Kribbella koreensis TaxID=57909 RepID=A0ABP4BB49_9ACTN